MSLSTPIQFRLSKLQEEEIKTISELTGLDTSKVIRLIIRNGLPSLRKQFGIAKKGGAA